MSFFIVRKWKLGIVGVGTQPFVIDMLSPHVYRSNARVFLPLNLRAAPSCPPRVGEPRNAPLHFPHDSIAVPSLIRADAKFFPSRFNHLLAALGTMSQVFALFRSEGRAIQHETDKHCNWDVFGMRGLIHGCKPLIVLTCRHK